MRTTLVAVSLLGLLGAAGFVGWSVLSRPDTIYITGEAAESFNLKEGPAPARAPAPMSPGETLRDAVASAPPAPSSLMKPIGFEGLAINGVPAKSAAASAAQSAPTGPLTKITPRAEAWARKHPVLASLITRPAAMLMGHTPLKSSREMRSFLADPRAVDRYMNSSIVRVALNSPTVAKTILGNPAVVRAFLSMPAMKDPQTVKELLTSPMVKKMLSCDSISEALADPVVIQKMLGDPGTISFLTAHPEAMEAIGQAAPAMNAALGSRGASAASFRR